MIFVVITQMYVADIIGKLPEKFYRVDSGEVRLLDVEHHMKIRTEARFQFIHKLRRLPVMMDNIFLGEDYPLFPRVADEQAKTLGVFVRADIHRQLCAVKYDYFRAYRRRGGIIFFVKLPVIVEAALILTEENIASANEVNGCIERMRIPLSEAIDEMRRRKSGSNSDGELKNTSVTFAPASATQRRASSVAAG